MADVKWIKVSTDMFDSSRKIKQIEMMPEGDTILVIWLKLLLLAGNVNDGGAIYLTPEIPYTEEMLATELRRPLNTVKMALTIFEKFGMIEIVDDILRLSAWEKYQNVEGMERIREQNRLRQQRKREKAKQSLIGTGNVCEYCGKEGTTIDHIIPKASGGLDSPENTVCSCLSCNMKKTNRRIDIFLNELMHTSSAFELDRITSNKKIMKYVIFDDAEEKFLSRDITGQITGCHAVEEEGEEDQEKESHSITHSAREEAKLRYLGGTLGKGVVMLSDDQFNSLLDELSLEEFNKYVGIVADMELSGKHYKKKTHYQAILDMAKRDRRTNG